MAYRKDKQIPLNVGAGEVAKASEIIARETRGLWRDEQMVPDAWITIPEIPTAAEIMPPKQPATFQQEIWDDYKKDPVYDPKLPVNIVDGAWPSIKAYQEAHYRLLREDAIAPLRNAVANVQQNPGMDEDKETRIYTHVFITGLLLSRFGPSSRIEFSTERAEKSIRWAQSTRLLQGTMVALSPVSDMFRTICKVAIVAARPVVGGLDQNPPAIDIFWQDPIEMQLDTMKEWIMVEAPQGYYEAARHVLVGLQKARTEEFPLSKHIAGVEKDIEPPQYVQRNPVFNLEPLEIPKKPGYENTLLDIVEETDYTAVNVLEDFPQDLMNGMDASQLMACKSMLTQQIAIVQGPPGTGKTFVSVAGLKVMIKNLNEWDPPIVVAAQTNHALDQLLNHVLAFEPKVVRIGGRSDKDNKEIHDHTLYELRQAEMGKGVANLSSGFGQLNREYKEFAKEIEGIIAPLANGRILTAEALLSHGILTEQQVNSLRKGKKGNLPSPWANDDSDGGGDPNDRNPKASADENGADIRDWLGEHQITLGPRAPPIKASLLEEFDVDFEQMQEIEEEALGLRDDPDDDGLKGKWIPFYRRETSTCNQDITIRQLIKDLTHVKDLNKISPGARGLWYKGFEKAMINSIQFQLRPIFKKYRKYVEDFEVNKHLNNFKLIRHLETKVVGCTTTGLAKYRPLFSALQPRTLLIEEAAETMEAMVTAGMVASLQQLILVGDHKQLQAFCNIQALQEAPYHMKVSMFERLVDNALPFTMLNTQRRMVPSIRKLLTLEPQPFYNGLTDHSSVLDRDYNRPLIPGMGDKDLYFFQHEFPEHVDKTDFSRLNKSEADMIAGFFNYLTLNGTDPTKITILTFYNGQRKQLLRQLRDHPDLKKRFTGFRYKVYTVDSYQGEENDIILLSLVRSNEKFQIGFLDAKNRAVVALSRARRALYIFGNALTLMVYEKNDDDDAGRDQLWKPIIRHLGANGNMDMDMGLPITCTNHGNVVPIFEPADWSDLAGGCSELCGGHLACGHPCILRCHPFSHELLLCSAACTRQLECGHGCSRSCGEECQCDACYVAPRAQLAVDVRASVSTYKTRAPPINLPIRGPPVRDAPAPALDQVRPSTSIQAWQTWNAEEDDRRRAESSAPASAGDSAPAVIQDSYVPIAVGEEGQRTRHKRVVREIVRK